MIDRRTDRESSRDPQLVFRNSGFQFITTGWISMY